MGLASLAVFYVQKRSQFRGGLLNFKGHTREGMLAPSITHYSPTRCFLQTLDADPFPLHSELTVWYDRTSRPETMSNVTAGMGQVLQKWFGISLGWL